MPLYEVYATRWDDPRIVEELIPARGLEFTLPLSDHGECAFSATVEPGKSFWRQSIAPVVSGVLVCRDDVPVWCGRVWSERQSGPRTFDFTCAEWGSFFERIPPAPRTYTGWNDHAIFRDLIVTAQAVPGQNPQVQVGSSVGASTSNLTINAWDDTTVEAQFRALGDAQGGPEWYFTTAGTLDSPQRVLVLADRAGRSTPQGVLEYVETTDVYTAPAAPPVLTTLGNLFPGVQPQAVVGGRRGGNVIAHPARVRDGSASATATVAVGAGSEAAQLRRSAASARLLTVGYPLLTTSTSYPDVTDPVTLQRHADADLTDRAGLLTSYTFTTLDGDPDWTQVQRGDTLRAILDTDVYASDRPLEFSPRLLEVAVQVRDTGAALVNWTVVDQLEVA